MQPILVVDDDGEITALLAEYAAHAAWRAKVHQPGKGLTRWCPLSNAQFRLLCTFLRMPRRIVSRDQLMEQARGRAMDALDALERSIDLLVSRLRSKLADDPHAPSMIRAVRGAGYLFNVQSLQGRVGWLH